MSTAVISAAGANGAPLIVPHLVYRALMPVLILSVAALVLLLISAVVRERLTAGPSAGMTALAGIAACGSCYWMWQSIDSTGPRSAFGGAIAFDHFSICISLIIGIALVFSAVASIDWLEHHEQRGPEYFVLMITSAVGGMIMAAANDLIVIFLGLEILSIALYVLVGFARDQERSREASLKYFVLGSLSSAIFLYGIALLYGATGTTNLGGISEFLTSNVLAHTGLLFAGTVLLLVGFAFKIAAVPFHQWTPDVYQGAPTPVTGFMAAAAKTAAFAALLRVFASALYTYKLDWQPIILVLAVLTLLVGSVVACAQQNVKRMLAYSSVSHAGYILLGLQAGTKEGVSASLFYLLAYTFLAVGSFAIVSVVGGQGDGGRGIEAFRGLGHRRPALGLAFTVLLVAQAGIPLTSGFLAKFYVISSLVANHSYGSAVFGMVLAAVAAYFYLRLVVVMYASWEQIEEPQDAELVVAADGTVAVAAPFAEVSVASGVVIALAALATLFLGILPYQVVDVVKFVQDATADLF